MIERMPKINEYKPSNIKSFVWQRSHRKVDLTSMLQQLYQSSKQRDRTLFGVGLYQRDAGGIADEQEENGGRDAAWVDGVGALQKCDISYPARLYLSACHTLLNLQPISPSTISQYVQSLPNTQTEPEQIRIEQYILKIAKYKKCLSIDLAAPVFSLQSGSMRIEDNKYHLDSFDRMGKDVMMEYVSSLRRVWVGGVGYWIDGDLRIVDSCEGFMAVATANTIYIIPLKYDIGNSYRFSIDECIDIKWSSRGLYYLQKQGRIGLLQRQTTFIPKSNKFSQSKTHQLPAQFLKQYTPLRLAISGITTGSQSGLIPNSTLNINNNLLLLSVSNNNKKRYMILIVDSSSFGMTGYSGGAMGVSIGGGSQAEKFMVLELKEVNDQVLYRNIVNINGQISVVFINGVQSSPRELHQYKIGTY